MGFQVLQPARQRHRVVDAQVLVLDLEECWFSIASISTPTWTNSPSGKMYRLMKPFPVYVFCFGSVRVMRWLSRRPPSTSRERQELRSRRGSWPFPMCSVRPMEAIRSVQSSQHGSRCCRRSICFKTRFPHRPLTQRACLPDKVTATMSTP